MKKHHSEIQILVLSESHGPRYVLYPTEDEDRQKVFLKLFKEREEDGFYEVESMKPKLVELYENALKGDAGAASILMSIRSGQGAEHETFSIHTLEEL